MRCVQAWGVSPWSAFMATSGRGRLGKQIRGGSGGEPAELADLQASQADVAGRIVRILAIAAGFPGVERDRLPGTVAVAPVEDASPNARRRR